MPRNSESPSIRKLVVGLGNPGVQYTNTRHNVGFSVVDLFTERHMFASKRVRHNYELYSYLRFDVLKPITYMNLSGTVLPRIWTKTGGNIQNTLIICDNLDLPMGHLRFKPKGSSAGQKGLQNVIDVAGTQDFARIFIGIGKPHTGIGAQSISSYVLSKFTLPEQIMMEKSYFVVISIIGYWVTGNITAIREELALHAKSFS